MIWLVGPTSWSKNFRVHKQPSRSVLRKRCSENKQQINRRTPKLKNDFNKVALQIKITLRLGCSPVYLLHIFRIPFPKNTSRRLVSNFIEIAHRLGCSPANLLHFFWTTFPKNTSGRLPRKSRYLRKSSRTYSKIF